MSSVPPGSPVRPEPSGSRPGWLVLIALAVVVVLALAWWSARPHEEAVTVLDPARVRIVRTPGGMLEVATLQKVEEFGWQVSHTCPLVDCGELLGKTTSRVRVTAHVTYRIPLAEQWTLRLDGDHYELVVPPLEPKLPVAFETAGMQVQTERGGWFSPAAGPNREAVVRQLGPELAVRARRAEMKRLAEPGAAATVAEFASRWMAEQMEPAAQRPIRVRFEGEPVPPSPAQ
ncbi:MULTISPECIES: hypothetical protein [Ramlibacter]|uniref:DUF4230 domain-containing protein n=1 Tax=Ramlibacter pinisoli TaxID=2682844 RepID=A0A6N8IMK4_9BURK|nr:MULTISPECIES: hypothetical protein [Ramlibacter]MBA2963109.1 hypothetical protein [Ramlibacter sp. CGMCC 1.13660]MVQ28079.1 hypothetical protein [Ramlibacter pinisoli]